MKKIIILAMMASCISCACIASPRIRKNDIKEREEQKLKDFKYDGRVWTMYQREAQEPVDVTYFTGLRVKANEKVLHIEKGKMYWVVEQTNRDGDIDGTQMICLTPNDFSKQDFGKVKKDNYIPFYNASVAWDDLPLSKECKRIDNLTKKDNPLLNINEDEEPFQEE